MSGDNAAVLILDSVLQIDKGCLFLGTQFWEEPVVVGLIELQIVFVTAEEIQRAQGVEHQRGPNIPVCGGMEFGQLVLCGERSHFLAVLVALAGNDERGSAGADEAERGDDNSGSGKFDPHHGGEHSLGQASHQG